MRYTAAKLLSPYLLLCSFETARTHQTNIISAPPKPLTGRDQTVQLREFIIEQRKIISSFRSQPWPMYMKMEAIRLVGDLKLFDYMICLFCRNYKANILTYVPQLSTIDAFRDKSRRVSYICKIMTVFKTCNVVVVYYRQWIESGRGWKILFVHSQYGDILSRKLKASNNEMIFIKKFYFSMK